MRAAVSAGEWLAFPAQPGVRDGRLAGGAQAQAAQALANLRTVVETHGARLADVVKANVFLVTMQDYEVMNVEYAKVSAVTRLARLSRSASFPSAH